MSYNNILDELNTYITTVILKGKANDLTTTTSLLEEGILSSLELMKLIGFIEDKFTMFITPDLMTPENFENLETIASVVAKLADQTCGSK